MKSVLKSEVKSEIAELLKPILADEQVLYIKVRNYHWNITGSQFFALHAKYEELYTELASDVDEIAEKIRALGVFAPGSMSEFLKLSGIKEEKENNHPDQYQMTENIANDYEFLSIRIKDAGTKVQNLGDEVTAGQLYTLAEKYDKHIWMLKSMVQK